MPVINQWLPHPTCGLEQCSDDSQRWFLSIIKTVVQTTVLWAVTYSASNTGYHIQRKCRWLHGGRLQENSKNGGDQGRLYKTWNKCQTSNEGWRYCKTHQIRLWVHGKDESQSSFQNPDKIEAASDEALTSSRYRPNRPRGLEIVQTGDSVHISWLSSPCA